MSTVFKEVLSRRNDLLHRKSVWQEVVDHLGKFLDTDAIPATVGIRTDAEGMVVPQEKIALVISEIENGYAADIESELEQINTSEVADNVREKKQSKKKKVSKSKKASRSTKPRSRKANR